MGEEKDLDDHERETENKNRDHFPAGETGQIMSEKKEGEADRGNNSRQGCSRNFEFKISAHNSGKQKQRRECREPKRELLEASGIDRNDVAFEVRFFYKIDNRLGNTVGEQRFPIYFFRRFLGIESEQCSLRMNHAIADLHFLVLVHERFADVGIVSVPERGAPDQGRPVRNGFLACGQGKIFTGRQNRRGRTNRTNRRHVDMLRRQGNESAGRSSVRVNKRVRGNGGMIKRTCYLFRAIEASAVSIHFEDDRARAAGFGGLKGTTQKSEK